ncbi:MAG: GntR family transcriptional regulator [Inquilinaceae bacterium]
MSAIDPPDSPAAVPLYRQVKDILVRRIAGGDWQAGDLLPSEPKLAAELGVSPGTVRKALDEMTLDQLVVRRQGKGTFVATATSDSTLFRFFKLVDRGRDRIMPASRQIGRRAGRANRREREVFGLEAGDRVVRIRRVRSAGGVDMMIETVILPLARFPAMETYADDLPNTLYDLYQLRFGVTVRRVEEVLTAVPATAEEATLFGLREGAPVLEMDRRAFSFDAKPVEWRLSRLDCRRHAYLSTIE